MIVLTLLVAALIQTSAPAMRTLDDSERNATETEGRFVFRTPAEWEPFWRRHANDRPIPSVDFEREMIVVACLGTKPTSGYAIQIVSVGMQQGALTVRFREGVPGPDAMTAQVLTSPCHIVAVPKASGTARFERIN